MIALTFLLVRHCIILTAFRVESNYTGIFPEHLSNARFLLLLAATLLIAAAGYIVNDVFDVTSDAVNRPGRNIFEYRLPKNAGYTAFFLLGGAGSLIGFLAGLNTVQPAIALLPLFTTVSLWMYSAYYKRRLLTGNFLVAALSALSVLLPGLYEPSFYPNISVLLPFGVFAFLVSLAREIIKDMEDVEGDEKMQCRTLPIQFGIRTARITVICILVLTAGAETWLIHSWFATSNTVSWWNIAFSFTVPLAGLVYLVATADEQRDFHFASIYAKLYLLLGMLSIFPFWYFFLR
ncbi:MAG: hypothetical protein RL213_235 [Bacteroidota bacterium]